MLRILGLQIGMPELLLALASRSLMLGPTSEIQCRNTRDTQDLSLHLARAGTAFDMKATAPDGQGVIWRGRAMRLDPRRPQGSAV